MSSRLGVFGPRAVLAAALVAGLAGAASAQDTLDRIMADGSVKIGIANERPYGYVETDGTVAGSVPGIVRAALEPHGVTELEPQIVDFNALIPGLNAKRFDIIAAGMYINPQRCEAIAFTNPITRAGYGFAAKAGNPKGLHSVADVVASPDARVGTQTGSAQVEALATAGVPQDRTVLFANATEALAGLRADRVDVIFFPGLELGALLATANDPGLERVTPFEQAKNEAGEPAYGYAAFGVRKGDEALRETLNTEIARLIESGEMLEIISQYGYGEDELPTPGVTAEALCAG
ncbi:MAG TPA: ectoine/hydroxyectoine ABC transporter substrate-binding protein EhuB [Amaricoccus sp.]|nr:ectoine/hydroxyectoine ABC transporter substrate-binding protein EhuB [Amaricoccus sp.]